MQPRADRRYVIDAVTHIFAHYPRRNVDENQVSAYVQAVQGLMPTRDELDLLVKTVPHEFPKFMPAAGELLSIIRNRRQRHKADDKRRAAEAEATYEKPELPADHPGEKLARAFELESQQLGIFPGERTPPHIAKRRMAAIQAMLSGHPVEYKPATSRSN